MPLLCISFLALLLLPLSLSCHSKRPPTDVRNNYLAIVQTDLENAREAIAARLQNSSCPELKHKPHNCTTDGIDVVGTLHSLTCQMRNLRLSLADRLTTSALNSIGCPCVGRPTKEKKARKKRTAAAEWRNDEKTGRRKIRKLCRSNAILSTMTECYEVLNDILMET